MSVEYSKRAVADLHKLSADIRRAFGDRAAERSKSAFVKSSNASPSNLKARRVLLTGQASVLCRLYPYRIFYRVIEGQVRILHIRPTSRKPWQRGE
jgi:mRNA-degrading endonuclease RelE of RelBE toxin-antitoxin system